jgi:hypothetical protein
MFKFGNICQVNNQSWDIFLGPWPSNNHRDLKVQKALEVLDELGFH